MVWAQDRHPRQKAGLLQILTKDNMGRKKGLQLGEADKDHTREEVQPRQTYPKSIIQNPETCKSPKETLMIKPNTGKH